MPPLVRREDNHLCNGLSLIDFREYSSYVLKAVFSTESTPTGPSLQIWKRGRPSTFAGRRPMMRKIFEHLVGARFCEAEDTPSPHMVAYAKRLMAVD